MPLTKELIDAARCRSLLGGNEGMNDTNAEVLLWCLETFPGWGVPDHLADGVEELMKLPPTEKIDRATGWICIAIIKEYEHIAFEKGIQLFDEDRNFNLNLIQ